MSRGAAQSAISTGFAKWAPILAHKPETQKLWNQGNRHLSNHIQPRASKRGLLYRGRGLPSHQQQLFVPHYTLASAKRDGYLELQPEPLESVYTRGPPESIARLSHGLDIALKQPGVHFVKDPMTGEYNFPPYVGTLHQPDQVDYDRMPPFITSSKDVKLHEYAHQKNSLWKGSTSSVSGALSQLYHLYARFRPVNLHNLSEHFQHQASRFSPASRSPVVLKLIPKDGAYAIDRQNPQRPETILSSLGKSYERMVTMDQDEFEGTFLKTSGLRQDVTSSTEDTYNYLQIGNYMLRSQLDCYDAEAGVFDLKSRATNPIRIYADDDPTMHLGYKLTRLMGPTNSFEREYYDMTRSAFLRNIFQVRIGDMAGIFVAFHNTQEVFGFEHINLDDMEQCIFQSKRMADITFDVTLKLLDQILQVATSSYQATDTLRVMLKTQQQLDSGTSMYIFVEKVDPDAVLPAAMPTTFDPEHLHSIKCFKLTTETVVDSKFTRGVVNIYDDNDVRVLYKLGPAEEMQSAITLHYIRSLQELYPTKERKMPARIIKQTSYLKSHDL